MSDGFTLSTTGSGTTSGYMIVVIVPDNNGVPYKNYTVSFTGTFTVPTDPSHGSFSSNTTEGSGSGGAAEIAGSGSQTVEYTADNNATRAQIGADLSSITYNGAGKVTVTATDGSTSLQATQAYEEGSIGCYVYLSSIGGGPKHYTSLSDAYNDASYTDPTIRLLTDITENTSLKIMKDVTITSDSGVILTITRTSDSNLMLIENGTVTLEDVKITDQSGLSPLKALIRVGENRGDSKTAGLVLGDGALIEGITMNSSSTSTETGIVLVWKTGTLTMNEGSKVKGCKGYGAPIYCAGSGGLFVMNGGTIIGCDSWIFMGTAVSLVQGSTMEMNGGTITECGMGGSLKLGTIYLQALGSNSFVMKGGEIRNNTVGTDGDEKYDGWTAGGVYVVSNNSNRIEISGDAVIYGNHGSTNGASVESNVYLGTNQKIIIGEGGLTSGAKIGVCTEVTPTEGSDVVLATDVPSGASEYFHSDDASATVTYNESTGDLCLAVKKVGTMTLGKAPTGVTVVSGSLDQSPGAGNDIDPVVLQSSEGYATLKQNHAAAIAKALDGSGLTVTLSDGKITISGKMPEDSAVEVDLESVLSGDDAPALATVKLTQDGKDTTYSSISDALNDARSGATVTLLSTSEGTDESVLKAGVKLVTTDGSTFDPVNGDAKISVGADGKILLVEGGLAAAGKDGAAVAMDVASGQGGGSKLSVSGTSYAVQTSDGCAKLVEGTVQIGDGAKILVGNADTPIENGASNKITVTGVSDGSGIVSIPEGGKAKVGEKEISAGSADGITVDIDDKGGLSVTMSDGDKAGIGDDGYEAAGTGAKILIGNDGNTLASGAVKVDQNGKITIGNGYTVTNEGTGDVTVSVSGGDSSVKIYEGGTARIGEKEISAGAGSQIAVDISEDGKLMVEVPSGNKATIGSMGYEAAAEGAKILIDENKNVLESGAVKIGKDNEVSVGESKTAVKGLAGGDGKEATVTARDDGSGSVSIPAGGKAEIGAVAIESIGAQVTAEVGKDGKISVAIDAGQTVRIEDSTYTGDSSHGSKISIDPDTGVVTVYDVRKIGFDTGTGQSIDMDCGKGETIALPDGKTGQVIEKEGSVLVGWMSDDGQGGTKNYGLGFDYTVGEDETLKAVWVENEDVVVYRTDDGGSIEGSTYAVPDDGIASLDSTVVKDGYAFLGWTATDSAGNKVAYAPGLTVKASGTTYMTAYLVPESSLSGLCTVKYDSGYSGGIAFKQYAESGVYVSLPTARDMHRDGYTFLGWEVAGTSTAAMAISLGAEMGDRVSGTYLVSEDVTFTAVWAAEGSDEQPWWDDDDDPYIPYHPSTGGSSDGSMDTILIVAVAACAVLALQVLILMAYKRD